MAWANFGPPDGNAGVDGVAWDLFARFWHEAAVHRSQNEVRFLGYSGREMLAARLSHLDPERTEPPQSTNQTRVAGECHCLGATSYLELAEDN
jgi:hypothetical protein